MDNRKNAKSERSITARDIAETIEALVPRELQEDWDNSGLLIGFREKPVRKVLTCLEIDREVFEEARAFGADMIVTHHPLIFHGMKAFCDDDYQSSVVMDLISSGISVYSCHTPFDKVKGGNNDIVMQRLGLGSLKNLNGKDIVSAQKMMERREEADIGRIGVWKKPISYKNVIQLVAEQLEISIRQLRVIGPLDRDITTVGVCTGAGADLAQMAAAAGCELFITGDVKYHEAREAVQSGMCILDAGHYGTEKFFAAEMKSMLKQKLGDLVEIVESKIDLDPFAMV